VQSIVIYYSQSGNTQIIAQAIQKGIARENKQCDTARLKEVSPEELVNYDLIGLGSPIWSCEPTPNVQAYIKSIPAGLKSQHFFFFCTHGTLPGQCILAGVKLLQEQGLTVIGWHDWYASVNLAGHPKPYFTDGHPDAIDVQEAETFGSKMAENSRKIAQGAADLMPKLPEGKEYAVIYGEPVNIKHTTEPASYPVPLRGELRINAEKCTGCGLCTDNCICQNIDFSVSPPVFKTKNCAKCLYCEGICPTGAIEYDFQPPEANFSSLRVFQKVLALAEAKGRFRRLVREEDIGWYTPWEKVTKHPRLKVP
jgi:flavodoxin/formate hydrogenlyase subunit 6/NADH:ubiquinone oxidoreductase subunit I